MVANTQAGRIVAPPTPSPRERAIAWAAEVAADPRTVFLDTETTGLGPEAEIVDIAVVGLDGTVCLDTLVKPTQPIPPEAAAVHGITDAMVADAPPWRLVYPLIEWWLDHRSVVIYNAQFDLKMIDQCRRAAGLRDGLDPALAYCAMLQYSAFDGTPGKYPGSMKWHKLERAAERFGITPGTHRALADAEACRQVVLAMAKQAH